METKQRTIISVEANIKAPIYRVWEMWTTAEHITKWNTASDDWQTTFAENDLRKGGHFLFRMEAKDRSSGFDFDGVYDDVKINQLIEYTLSDARKVRILFMDNDDRTKIIQSFEAEESNTIEEQRDGWQNILNNFKKYVERRV